MDFATIIGYALAWGALLYGAHHASHGSLGSYFKPSEILLVGGCALGATLASMPLHNVKTALLCTKKMLLSKPVHIDHLIHEIVGYAETARKDGVLALETVAREAADPFVRRGLSLTVDGTDPEIVEQIMRIEVDAMAERHKHGKHFWASMAKFGPGCGLVACLVAQVALFKNLDGGASVIGAALAVALTGTLYGALLQNLVAGPIAEKLGILSKEEIFGKEIIVQGILSIQAGNNPRVVEMQLLSYVSAAHYQRMSKHACKCDPHEICEECPEWIFTLADLIMCMMGLFVVLWVLKPDGNPGDPMTKAQEERQIEVIAGIRDAFGYQPDPGSTDPIDLAVMRQQISTGRLAGPQNKGVVKQKIDGATGSDPEVTSVRTGPKAVVGGRVLFAAGKSDLSADAEASLDQIAERIRGHRNVVMVKGHAALDDVADPELDKTALMNLSVRRAQVAADYLVTKGVEPEVLRVQGAGPFEPVVRRAYTPAAMANNRRVEVEATATRVEELQDSAAPRGMGVPPVSAPSTSH